MDAPHQRRFPGSGISRADIPEYINATGRETVSFELVGPSDASELMSKSEDTKIRKTSRNAVRSYLKELQDGEWTLTGQGITLDERGRVIDGFHRLAAIVEFGRPVPLVVVRGAMSTATTKIDEGRRRVITDFLAHAGETHVWILASALRWIFDWRHEQLGVGRSPNKLSPTINELLDLLEECGDPLRENVRRVVGLNKTAVARIAPNGLQVMMWFHASRGLGDEYVDEWIQLLVHGAPGEEPHPVNVLRRRHLDTLSSPAKTRAMTEMYRAALYVKAWNSWILGDTPARLSWAVAKGESFPSPIFEM